jgi:hypothetical protein
MPQKEDAPGLLECFPEVVTGLLLSVEGLCDSFRVATKEGMDSSLPLSSHI